MVTRTSLQPDYRRSLCRSSIGIHRLPAAGLTQLRPVQCADYGRRGNPGSRPTPQAGLRRPGMAPGPHLEPKRVFRYMQDTARPHASSTRDSAVVAMPIRWRFLAEFVHYLEQRQRLTPPESRCGQQCQPEAMANLERLRPRPKHAACRWMNHSRRNDASQHRVAGMSAMDWHAGLRGCVRSSAMVNGSLTRCSDGTGLRQAAAMGRIPFPCPVSRIPHPVFHIPRPASRGRAAASTARRNGYGVRVAFSVTPEMAE